MLHTRSQMTSQHQDSARKRVNSDAMRPATGRFEGADVRTDSASTGVVGGWNGVRTALNEAFGAGHALMAGG